MVTTIQVKEDTMRLLEALKNATHAKSYDEAIRTVLAEKFKVPTTMFGVDKGKIAKFTERDRLEDRDADIR